MNPTKLTKLRQRRTPRQLAKRAERIKWRKTSAKLLEGVRVNKRSKWLDA